MNLDDLAAITGKSVDQVRSMLDEQNEISLNLSERGSRKQSTVDEGSIQFVS